MPYGLIILFGSISLIVYFDFVTEASWAAKIIVSGIFIFSLALYLGWLPYIDGRIGIVIGRFLLVGVSIFIIFYRTWEQNRSG
jgi:hypothetical protein